MQGVSCMNLFFVWNRISLALLFGRRRMNMAGLDPSAKVASVTFLFAGIGKLFMRDIRVSIIPRNKHKHAHLPVSYHQARYPPQVSSQTLFGIQSIHSRRKEGRG